MAGNLEVHVVTPEREVWVGDASMVIARAVDGDVGILPGHAPMVAAMDVGALYIESEGEGRVTAVVDGGFVHVVSLEDGTRVDILAEFAEFASEISSEDARRFEERASELRDAEHYAEARTELAKGLTRQRVAGS
jgi:F-type H+-transporting ATPase subunit epsilon